MVLGHLGGVVVASIIAVTVMERNVVWAKALTAIYLAVVIAETAVPAVAALAGVTP